MDSLDEGAVRRFLGELGRRVGRSERLILLGGSALLLLGSRRTTLDLDYVGNDLHKSDLQHVIDQLADEMQLTVEAVPFDTFIPLPPDVETKHLFVGRFGALDVYVYDPYAIAVSKIDRGFDTDIADVLFLVQSRLVDVDMLEATVRTAMARSREFDLDPSRASAHLAELRRLLRADTER